MNARSRIRNLFIGALAAALIGCGEKAPEPASTGDVKVAFAVPGSASGDQITSIQYVVDNLANTPIYMGTIQIGTDPKATTTVDLVFPAGSYYIEATATTTGGVACLTGWGGMTIVAGQTTQATLNMTCGTSNDTTGQADITIDIGNAAACPVLYASLSAVQVSVGQPIYLSAQDTEVTMTNVLSYMWLDEGGNALITTDVQTGNGTTTNSETSSGTYLCAVAGPHTITVQANNNDPVAGCIAQSTFNVSCQ